MKKVETTIVHKKGNNVDLEWYFDEILSKPRRTVCATNLEKVIIPR
jgi:hypothetical protein